MARKIGFLLLFLVLVISLGFFTLRGFGKDQMAQGNMDMKIISEKIDEVLKNQQDIIARLKDIREQEDIIRVRASR